MADGIPPQGPLDVEIQRLSEYFAKRNLSPEMAAVVSAQCAGGIVAIKANRWELTSGDAAKWCKELGQYIEKTAYGRVWPGIKAPNWDGWLASTIRNSKR